MNLPLNPGITMTSLELVDLINDHRKSQAESAGQSFPCEEFPELTHANLLQKVDKVLGKRSHSFECDLPDTYGRPRRGYRFPKREACLLAMSYSYELQASVFDRMTALEQRAVPAVAIPQSLPEALRMAADLAEQNDSLKQLNHDQSLKIDSLTSQFMEGETPPAFAKRLNGVNIQLVNARLRELGWLYDSSTDPDERHYRAASYARDRYLTESPLTLRKEGKKSRIRYSQVLLMAGAERLFDLYLKQKLPMKNTWDGRFSHVKFPRDTQ